MSRRLLLSLCILVLCVAAASKKEATQKLVAAAADGDHEKILAALKAGADPNAKNENKTPVLVTVSTQSLFGHEKEIIAAFVKAKANLNAGDADGATPLMAAAATDRGDILDALIAGGAKIEAKDNDGWTAVHWAVSNGNWSILDKLVAAKASIDTPAKDKYTPLMTALAIGKGSIAERLMKAGAKFPASYPDGASTLVHATSGRDLEAVRLALANNPKLDEPYADDGSTPLAIAAWNGDGQIVMELLRAGADASIKDKEGMTALDDAVKQEHTEIIALLGGKWDKPKPAGGKTISIPCSSLGGTVESNFALDGDALVVTTTFPHPVTYYLGGGNTNRAESAKKYTYEGSFTPTYELGNGYTVDYDQYGTTVVLHYTNSKGEEKTKHVYGNVLDISIKKGDQDVDLSGLDEAPGADNDNGVLRSKIPLSVLALKPGSTTKVTAKIGACKPVTEKVALK